MFRRLTATWPTWATLPMRLILGISFIAHGAQKVFGVLGGPGLSKWMAGPEMMTMGLRPAWLWLAVAAFSELLGGLLVLLGLLTRLGALMITGVMIVATGLTWGRGGAFFIQNQGIETHLWVIGMTLALLIAGGGRASVDEALSKGGRSYRR